MESTWLWVIATKPLWALLLGLLVLAPTRWLTIKLFPEGRIKKFLLTPISKDSDRPEKPGASVNQGVPEKLVGPASK